MIADSKADATASLWAARLDGSTLTVEQREALDRWLAADPQHRILLSRYCQFGADLEHALSPLRSDAEIIAPTPTARTRRPWRPILLAGLAVAAAWLVLLVVLPDRAAPTQLATRVGERTTTVLDDGSTIELNAQTAAVVSLNETERRVRLAQGQAFFDVKPDAARPFIVETPQGSVRVTGTRFDVRTDSSQPLEVVVAQGAVQVAAHDAGGATTQPVQLAAGQRYSGAGSQRVIDLTADELADALAWRQGQIVFREVLLRDALARFGRYHGRSLAADPSAGALRIGGRFSLDDLDGFLAALEEIFPVEVSQNRNGTIHIRLLSRP